MPGAFFLVPRPSSLVPYLATLALAGPLPAQARDGPVDWTTVAASERATLTGLLESPDWPFRVFGLLRLERFRGDGVEALVRAGVTDSDWQVRCFALRQAQRMGIEVSAEALAAEREPRVIRAALRHGVALDDQRMKQGAKDLMRTKALEELMLGLEIAAASQIPALRTEAEGRIARLIRNMDDGVCALSSRRLAALLEVSIPPGDAQGWRAWLKARGDELKLPSPLRRPPSRARGGTTLVAEMDPKTLGRLLDYLDALRKRDLDLAIVMDSTASMLPMINEARAGVDSLILFLSDISGSMRLAFVAYRDHDNEPVWEGHRFTDDVESIRRFLFDLRITGGADYPEAVLEGVTACRKLDWNRRAVRQMIVVGDAPPHDEDREELIGLIETVRSNGILVNAVHVPMRRADSYYRTLSSAQVAADRQWLEDYNRKTAAAFAQMAELGAGHLVTLGSAGDLVPAIMRFTIAEPWWPVFDEFYALYRELCR